MLVHYPPASIDEGPILRDLKGFVNRIDDDAYETKTFDELRTAYVF